MFRVWADPRRGLPALAVVLLATSLLLALGPSPIAIAADRAAKSGGDSTEVIINKIEGGDTVRVGRVVVRSGGRAARETDSLDIDVPDLPIDVEVGVDADGDDLVGFGEDVTVEEGQTVNGDVVSIGGKVHVFGEVVGDAVSLGGGVHVGPRGIIHGDAVTVGGRVDAEEGAEIRGKNVSVGVGPRWIFGPGLVHHGVRDAIHWGGRFVFAVVLLLLGWLIVTLMGRRLDVIGAHLERQWPLSLAVGFLVTLLVPPVFIMLLITIIGIPLSLLLMPAYVLGVLVGFFTSSVRIGRFVLGRAGRGPGSNAGAMAVGVGLLVITMLVGALLWRVGQPLTFLGGFLQAVGAIIFSVAGLCGLGALVVSQFGSKGPQGGVRPAPPTPGAPPAGPTPGSAFVGAPPPPWTPGAVPYEGAAGVPPAAPPGARISDKRILPALLLCIFFGWLGVHRFYVGKIGTGIVQVLTFGGLGIWVLIDLILIIAGAFTDQSGAKITLWT